jgi:hypothetical protein
MTLSKVLFHIGNFPACNEMFVIIDAMLERTGIDVYVFVENKDISKYIATNYADRNIHLIDYYSNKQENIISEGKRKKRLVNNIKKKLVKEWRKFKDRLYRLRIFDEYKRKKLSSLIAMNTQKAQKVVSEIQPDSLVVRGDRHLGNHWEGALLKVCGDLGVPRIIVPVAASGFEGRLKMRRGRKTFLLNEENPLLKEFTKQVVFDSVSEKYLLYKPAYILRALRDNGMLPDNPWVLGGGNSDKLLVDSEHAKQRFVREGVLEEKVVITGHGSHDTLHQIYTNRVALKESIVEQYGLNLERKTVLVALPQLGEHKILPWEEHWKEIHFICETLQALEANVLVSLHPRMNPENYRFVEDEYDLSIVKERLYKVLPAVDVYICTFSSTLEWSVMCGIPTVIIDFYGFNYTMYDDIDALSVISQKTDFATSVERLVLDKTYYESVMGKTKKSANKFGAFDGCSLDRIINELV